MFMLRINNQKVLTMGSMNFIEREIEGLDPDILLAGVNLSRFNMYKYDERLLTVTGFPRIVIRLTGIISECLTVFLKKLV